MVGYSQRARAPRGRAPNSPGFATKNIVGSVKKTQHHGFNKNIGGNEVRRRCGRLYFKEENGWDIHRLFTMGRAPRALSRRNFPNPKITTEIEPPRHSRQEQHFQRRHGVVILLLLRYSSITPKLSELHACLDFAVKCCRKWKT